MAKKVKKEMPDAAPSNQAASSVDTADAPPPFEIKDLHTKALVTLLHCHHSNRQALTYKELSLRIGIGEKTKAWQCVAWKDLKTHEYIIPSSSSDKEKRFELSDKGVQLASTLASDEELAEFKVPETNEELHEKIKAKLARDAKAKRYGPKILDLMLAPDYVPLNRNEMAAKFNTLADSHGFFYGLKALKDGGMVIFCSDAEIAELKAAAAAAAAATAPPKPSADDSKEETVSCETAPPPSEEKKRALDDDNEEGCESSNEEPKKKEETNVEEEETVSGETAPPPSEEKKRALDDSEEGCESSNEEPKKKKKCTSTKKRSGGKPLKLSDLAYVVRPASSQTK